MNQAQHSATRVLPAAEYDLAHTLNCGQAFRWQRQGDAWTGVVDRRFVRLTLIKGGILAETHGPVREWSWLERYLQVEVDLQKVVATFPEDPHMANALRFARGMRLLQQDHWECLASFILSSTKQVAQIQQVIARVCECYGDPLLAPAGQTAFAFPTPERIAQATEADLRKCRMGFRAPYLLSTAQQIADERVDLRAIETLGLEEARLALTGLPGVGHKVADCVLLFSYGFQQAFPLDVWMLSILRQLYFPNKTRSVPELRAFALRYFGPYAGYAQQYLFHYMRMTYGKTRRLVHAR